MPVGMIVLLVVAGLIFFGAAHRVLDRMRLTDTQALIVIGLMIAGSFIDVPLVRDTVDLSVNVGGALIPLALAVYLLVRADTAGERLRSILAALASAAAVWLIAQFTDFEPPRNDFVDPLWLFAVTAGIVGYLVGGRSRRATFIGSTLGILLTDLVHLFQVVTRDVPAPVALGGAGVFDALVISGVIGVGLAELIGETRERLQGGPATGEGRPDALGNDPRTRAADGASGTEEARKTRAGDQPDGDEGLGNTPTERTDEAGTRSPREGDGQ